MRTIRRLLLAALLILPAVLVGCMPASPPPTVIVYGDSVAVMSESMASFFAPKTVVDWRAANGTALCDALPLALADAKTLHPRHIVLAFTGNNAGCAAAAWRSGGAVALTALYERDLRLMGAIWPSTPITILIPPACNGVTNGFWPANGSPLLVAMYEKVGASLGMTINMSAVSSLTPGGVFVNYRPALGTGIRTLMRTTEGVHLTLAGQAWYGIALLAGTAQS